MEPWQNTKNRDIKTLKLDNLCAERQLCAECPSLWMKARLQLTLFSYKPFCFCFLSFYTICTRKGGRFLRKQSQLWLKFRFHLTAIALSTQPQNGLFVARIHHFYIDHNAPCLLHKSLQNHCFQFLLEKLKTIFIAKFLGGKQGAYWSMWKWWISSGDIRGAHLLSGVALAWIGR